MCTYNGYYTTFDEKERGSLEEGKIADMVILSDNPYEMPKENLMDLKVEKLILSGEDYKPQTIEFEVSLAARAVPRFTGLSEDFVRENPTFTVAFKLEGAL